MFKVPKSEAWPYMPMYEKIKHYKDTLHAGYSPYVDKLEAKRIVKEVCGDQIRVARVRRILASPLDIQEADIHDDVLLKSTHGSGWNLDLGKVKDVSDIQKCLQNWNVPYKGANEPQYASIIPQFFIEEKIEDAVLGKTGSAFVYMIRCIHGKPCTISVKRQSEQITFDPEWNPLVQPKSPPFRVEKPACLKHMLDIATKLSAPFEFVRIDFYLATDGIYFSEYTFTPAGGHQVFPTHLERSTGALWI
jgi:hypothetical protein